MPPGRSDFLRKKVHILAQEVPATKPAKAGLLTPREQQIMSLLAQGRSNRSIADGLGLSAKTVEGAIGVIFSKLDLEEDARDNRRVLAVLAYLDGGSREG